MKNFNEVNTIIKKKKNIKKMRRKDFQAGKKRKN